MRFILFITLCFGLISCDSSQPTIQNPEPASKNITSISESPICLDITKLNNIEDSNALAQTNILELELIEGCICITYNYSGCTAGEPILVWNGRSTTNTHPTVYMQVYVKETGMCDQMQKASTCFNMVEMESVGTQVLVYLNGSKKNFLLNYQNKELKTD